MHRLLSGIVFRIVSAAALATLAFSCSSETAPRSDADVTVAEVDGARISLSDLKNEIAVRRGLTPSLSARSASAGEVREGLRAMIDRAVVLAEARRLGISVEGSEVEREVERYRADFPQGGLEKALLQAGTDMDGWKASLSRSLLYRKAAESIADSRVTVTDADVEAVFRRKAGRISRPERIKLRQFLFPSEESARDARKSIQEGKPPEEILRLFSAGDVRPTVAELGEVTREDLPPEIAAELFALPEGSVGGIVPREESYSIFQVIRKEAAGVPTLAAAAPGIREELRRSRREEAFRSWMAEQAGKAKIRVHEAVLDRLTGGEKQ